VIADGRALTRVYIVAFVIGKVAYGQLVNNEHNLAHSVCKGSEVLAFILDPSLLQIMAAALDPVTATVADMQMQLLHTDKAFGGPAGTQMRSSCPKDFPPMLHQHYAVPPMQQLLKTGSRANSSAA
jgi:hypothetical protein